MVAETDEGQALRVLRVAGELVGMGITLYMMWTIVLPSDVKERWITAAKARWRKLNAKDNRRKHRNELIFSLSEIADACPHELADEVKKLPEARR